jgi:hypothetical protein
VDALVGARGDVAVDTGADASGCGEAAVDGLWGVGHDGLTDLRANAVGADDEVTLDRGAVGKVGDDGLIRLVFDADETLVEVDGDALLGGAIDEDAMERGASDHDSGLTIESGVTGAVAGEKLAVLVFKGPFMAGDADVAHLVDDTGRGEDVHAVGSEAEAAAGLAGACCGFEDVGAEAGLFEKEREDWACDASADDENTFWIGCHNYLR